MKKRANPRGIQSFVMRNEKEIIQVMLATVLIVYMVIKQFTF